eukprot:PhF_6_TR2002/c1_g1_i1/m.3393
MDSSHAFACSSRLRRTRHRNVRFYIRDICSQPPPQSSLGNLHVIGLRRYTCDRRETRCEPYCCVSPREDTHREGPAVLPLSGWIPSHHLSSIPVRDVEVADGSR